MKRFPTALLLALFASAAWGQAPPTLRVDYTNPRLSPFHWTLTLHPDGSGHFRSDAEAVTTNTPVVAKASPAAAVDREIRLSPAFVQSAFATARATHYFQTDCESHLKVAFTGQKRLSYQGPEGSGSCEFNYSKNKQIQELGDAMISAANTILTGARLESLLTHDRLGLDKEIAFLAESVDRGNAHQVCAIREILLRLTNDDSVLDRVKRQARALLARVEN